MILISSYNAYAQDERGGINIEVKISPELANFNNKLYATDHKFSLSGGVLIEKGLNNWLNGQTGILYKNRGWQYKGDVTDINGMILDSKTMKSNFNYLSFPILLKAKYNNFYGSVGLSLDIFLHHSSDLGSDSDNINRINSSLYLAVGYRADLKENLFLNIEANFNPMLFPVYQESNLDMFVYNFGLGFGLGFSL